MSNVDWEARLKEHRKEMEKYQKVADIEWLNSRMEDGRMGRCLALIKREEDLEKQLKERTDHAAIVAAKAEKETKLGLEIAKVQREKACELLRRHYLRERDPSLRELMTKLRAGYASRDLKAQMLQNHYKRLQEKVEELHINQSLEKSLYSDKEALLREEEIKRRKERQYKQDIQEQLLVKERQKQCAYEDTLLEQKMLDDIMKTIADEDHREIEMKRELTEKLRHEMEMSLQARQAWKEKQKQLSVLEGTRVEAQQRAASDRTTAIKAEKARKLQEKEELNEKICAKILADKAAIDERQKLIGMLIEQEHIEKEIQNDLAKQDKAIQSKLDAKDALTRQMEEKRMLAKQQKLIDMEYRKQNEAKIAADAQKERDKVDRKKAKTRKYLEELTKQREEHAARKIRQKQEEEMRAQYMWDFDKAWRAEVSKEREKIVEEHAASLLGHLSASVLTESDMPALRSGANKREELKQLDLDSLVSKNKTKTHPRCNPQCMVLKQY